MTDTSELGKYAYVRVYDVRDIDGGELPAPGEPPANACFPDTSPPYASEREWLDDEFRMLVTDMVDPAGWVDNGGSVGQVECADGRLVILTTSEHHRAIQRLLDELRRSQNSRAR